jgi:hypothetical protein
MVPTTDRSQPNRVTWQNDGADTQYLLAWMMTEGNYSKFQGKNNAGQKKKRIADKLAEEINKLGFQRTGKDVLYKIAFFVSKFKVAQEFVNGTGSGVLDALTFE